MNREELTALADELELVAPHWGLPSKALIGLIDRASSALRTQAAQMAPQEAATEGALREALTLILPLAKGYVAAHRDRFPHACGSGERYLAQAKAALSLSPTRIPNTATRQWCRNSGQILTSFLH